MPTDTTVTLDTPEGLTVAATLDPNSEIVDQFYTDYEKAFVLPNEREELDGFRICLALNLPPHAQSLTRRYGPFREIVLVARDRNDGAIIGGANMIAFAPSRLPDRSELGPMTINLNYAFVVETARKRGYLRPLVNAVTPTARAMLRLGPETPALTFIEQNDPLRMSVEDYVRDTQVTGLDQVDRIGVWARLGARVVDFPYVQPPLSASQEPDVTLVYSAIGVTAPHLSACLLGHHLRRFFAISVLKDGDPDRVPSAATQLAGLDALCRKGQPIALLDPLAWVSTAGTAIRLKGRKPDSPPTLRAALTLAARGP